MQSPMQQRIEAVLQDIPETMADPGPDTTFATPHAATDPSQKDKALATETL